MRTKIIGLTGGIGSGKTTIAKYYESLGIPVYIADEEARRLLYTPDAVTAVKAAFGDEVFTDGLPDRKKLAEVVFANPDKLQRLNGIIHPLVKEHFKKWVASNSHADIVMKETAILFESGSYKDCDKIILVTAPEELRIGRVMERDGIDEVTVLERMKNQWSDEKKRELSDFVIENIVLDSAKFQAEDILKELKKHKK